jgi:hypothetical protein
MSTIPIIFWHRHFNLQYKKRYKANLWGNKHWPVKFLATEKEIVPIDFIWFEFHINFLSKLIHFCSPFHYYFIDNYLGMKFQSSNGLSLLFGNVKDRKASILSTKYLVDFPEKYFHPENEFYIVAKNFREQSLANMDQCVTAFLEMAEELDRQACMGDLKIRELLLSKIDDQDLLDEFSLEEDSCSNIFLQTLKTRLT